VVENASAAQVGATLCSLETLLERSDVVVVACLLYESTRHLLNADRLRLMRPTAYLIDVARGSIIDEAALIETLREGRIAGARLDVFKDEPPDSVNPLLTMETGPTLSLKTSPATPYPASSLC
jgi:phosphoglycerate dehydrogenase-like enzyme